MIKGRQYDSKKIRDAQILELKASSFAKALVEGWASLAAEDRRRLKAPQANTMKVLQQFYGDARDEELADDMVGGLFRKLLREKGGVNVAEVHTFIETADACLVQTKQSDTPGRARQDFSRRPD